jgi:glycosyltransferase involved in cell wall biosynthesis
LKRIAIVVLTYNEELHIERCLKQFSDVDAELYVIDSFSNDETVALAKKYNAQVFQNAFVSQSQQFDWAMINCGINAEWVLRVDADETIDVQLQQKITEFVQNDGFGHSGAVFERKHIFLDRWIRHGGRYPVRILRLFKRGCAHIEQKWMDEHIVLDVGTSKVIEGNFADHNLNSVTWFIDKHNKYATREMLDILLNEILHHQHDISENTGFSIRFRRFLKNRIYMGLPPFVRPVCYFLFRYFIQLGFLDGREGFAYHFMQGFWYRALVDLKLLEARKITADLSTSEEKLAALEILTGYKLRISK